MSKETSPRVAKIAGKILSALKTKKSVDFTNAELKALAASALAQVEQEKTCSPRWSQLSAKRKAMFTAAHKDGWVPKYLYTLAITIMDDVE